MKPIRAFQSQALLLGVLLLTAAGGLAEGKTSLPPASKPVVVFPETTAPPAIFPASEELPTLRADIQQPPPNPTDLPSPETRQEEPPPERVYNSGDPAMPSPTSSSIRAVMRNSQGMLVYLKPLESTLPRFAIGGAGKSAATDSMNMLFHTETDSLQQTVSRLISQAQQAHQGGKIEQAIQLMKEALRLDAENADLAAALGELYLEGQQWPEAIQAYRQALRSAPERHRLRCAQVFALAGQRGEAAQLLEKPFTDATQSGQRAYLLGTLHQELGQTGKALMYLNEAVRLQPDSADIRYNLGLAYELAGQKQTAYQQYRRAQALEPAAEDVRRALERLAPFKQ